MAAGSSPTHGVALRQPALLPGIHGRATSMLIEVAASGHRRRMLRLSLLDRRTNASIREQCGVPAIADTLQQRRLVWLGHLGRMGDDRLPKQMLFGRVAAGSRQRGRPKQTWKGRVLKDLADLKMSRWYQGCQDRSGWRHKVKAGGN